MTYHNILNKTNIFISWVGAINVALIAAIMGLDVFMRYVLNKPISWSLDLTCLLQVSLTYLCAGYVLKEGGHIKVEIIYKYLSDKTAHIMDFCSSVLAAITCGFMVYITWHPFIKNLKLGVKTETAAIPLAPWKFIVVIGFAILCVQFLYMARIYYYNIKR